MRKEERETREEEPIYALVFHVLEIVFIRRGYIAFDLEISYDGTNTTKLILVSWLARRNI